MKTPMNGDTLVNGSGLVNNEMLDEFYVEMSEFIDQLHAELTDFTPNLAYSFFFLRSNATKIFQNFIDDVRRVVDQAKSMDVNVQGTLFDD
jgi:hypothetical protein